MRGEVKEINCIRRMVAVKTEDGDYSIFEMLSDDNFNIGDEVNWSEEEPYGDCSIKNLTEDEEIDVYFQNHHVSQGELSSQLLVD